MRLERERTGADRPRYLDGGLVHGWRSGAVVLGSNSRRRSGSRRVLHGAPRSVLRRGGLGGGRQLGAEVRVEILLVGGARGGGGRQRREGVRRLPLKVPPQYLHRSLLGPLRAAYGERRSTGQIEGIGEGRESETKRCKGRRGRDAWL
jgi:hypothetical protein